MIEEELNAVTEQAWKLFLAEMHSPFRSDIGLRFYNVS